MKALLLFSLAFSASALAEIAIPEAFERKRYDETLSSSPFALATPPPTTAEPTDNDFNNLVVTAIAKLEGGRDYVIVHRVGEETDMRLEGTGENSQGFALKEIKSAKDWKDTAVIVRKGGKEGSLKFNANLTAAPAPSPVGKQPGLNQPKGMQGVPRPPVPTPFPGTPQATAPSPALRQPTGPSLTPNGGQFRNTAPTGTQPTIQSNSGPPRPNRIRTIGR